MRSRTQSEYEKAVNRVVDYINAHLYEMPSIREIGEIANISGFHFHRIFKAIIGENIGAFISRLRLEDVALHLLMSDDSLTDLAVKTGYGTKYALSKAFRNHFGISPSQYRIQGKKAYSYFQEGKHELVELDPEIRNVAAKTIVYVRIIDVYGSEESYAAAWYKLGVYAKKNNLIDESTEFIGLSFDDPEITHPSKCRFYAGFTPNRHVLPEGEFGGQQIRGGKYLVFLHKGPYYKLKNTYYNIFMKWLPQNNIEIRSSVSFEKYLNYLAEDVKEQDLLTEIYIRI